MKKGQIVRKSQDKYAKKRQILAVVSLCLVIVLFALITFFVYNAFKKHCSSSEEFKIYVNSFGIYGPIVAIAAQFLQVVIAIIPGEVVELGMGYAFGFWQGTLFCIIGSVLGSILIFALVRKFGMKLLNIIFDIDRINQLKFLKNEKKLNYYVFILFFIPGTPKDLLTYFAGLTKIKMSTFLIISTIARIPSVATSTIVGNLVGKDNYIIAIIIYAAVGVVSFFGIKVYNKIHREENEKIKRKELRKAKRAALWQRAKIKTKPKLGKIINFKENVKMKTQRIKVKHYKSASVNGEIKEINIKTKND